MLREDLLLLFDLKFAHWLRLDFPSMITPAALNFDAIVESRGTVAPSKANDPAVLFILSSVAILFLMIIGTP